MLYSSTLILHVNLNLNNGKPGFKIFSYLPIGKSIIVSNLNYGNFFFNFRSGGTFGSIPCHFIIPKDYQIPEQSEILISDVLYKIEFTLKMDFDKNSVFQLYR